MGYRLGIVDGLAYPDQPPLVMTSDLLDSLLRIGAIQFGRFESRQKPGTFAPVGINLRLLPSYPDILKALAAEVAPLVTATAATRLLAMPSSISLGTALALHCQLPMVYPSPVEPGVIEGAYDTYVSTVLLTDVLEDATAELALARRVKGLGLEVKAIVSVINLGILDTTRHDFTVSFSSLITMSGLLSKIPVLSSSLRNAIESWLEQQRQLIGAETA